MPRTVLLRGARQLVTLRGDGEHRPRQGAEMSSLGIIQDGAMLIVDGIIRQVGSSRRLEHLAEARHAEEIDATGRVVLPGFVDCLTQPLQPASPVREPSVKSFFSPRMEAELKRHLARIAAQGTLTMAARTAWDDDERASLKALRVLRDLAGSPLRLVPVVAARPETDLLDRVRQEKLAAHAWVLTESGGSLPSSHDARRWNLTLAVHGDAALALEGGATMLTGVAECASELTSACRDAGVVMVSQPAVDWTNRRPGAAVRAQIDAGLAVALASGFGGDGCAVSSLAAVMSLACANLGLTAAEAITAATINAAYALNLGREVGSLEPGKSADLLLLDASDYREVPMQLGTNLVHTAIRRGELVRPQQTYHHAVSPIAS